MRTNVSGKIDTFAYLALTVLCLVFLMVLHGALPFVSMPTLGHAMALTGFSYSFADGALNKIYADNFGYPAEVAHAMGLPITYLVSLLLRLGIHAADAYTTAVLIFLIIAFFGSNAIVRHFGLRGYTVPLMSVIWLAMPIIWGHAAYSSLSIGMALLPLYFNAWFRIAEPRENLSFAVKAREAAGYSFICFFALFMDGYSFSMFVFGVVVVFLVFLIKGISPTIISLKKEGGASYRMFVKKVICTSQVNNLLTYAFPVHVLGVVIAYLGYVSYVGQSGYSYAGTDFFRAWGVDLSFIAVPSQGMSWLADAIGISKPRSEIYYFGDASVWLTTFSLPIIMLGVWNWVLMRKVVPMASSLMILVVFAFYMSLGPSIKVDATKSIEMINSQAENGVVYRSMPKEFGVTLTGNELLSQNLPGFKNMRAAYRWLALSIFGLWLLAVLALVNLVGARKLKVINYISICLILVVNVPNMIEKLYGNMAYRDMFLDFDADVVDKISEDIERKELVVFLPYGNDFSVNYMAGKTGIKTYNVGGDKQLYYSMRFWPSNLRNFRAREIDDFFVGKIIELLHNNDADAVVVPRFNLLLSSYAWPELTEYSDFIRTLPFYSSRLIMSVSDGYEAFVKDQRYPSRDDVDRLISILKTSRFVDVQERDYYAVIRLKSDYVDSQKGELLEQLVDADLCVPPYNVCRKGFDGNGLLTQVGIIERSRLYSSGNRGFLLYGPYVPLNLGLYRLKVYGEVIRGGDAAWVDVVSKSGKELHWRGVLTQQAAAPGLIANADVLVSNNIDDLEIRVHVGTNDEVRVDGYSLRAQHSVY